MARIVNIDALRAERRKSTVETTVPFNLDGKTYFATKKIINGEMITYDFGQPLGEMITTAATRKELLEKVVLDVELGREAVPLLYNSIYDRKEDANFPQIFEAPWAQHGVVVFLEHMEGQEVKFGHLQAEQGPDARILTYAAGFEYTEDMQVYNQTYAMEELDRAFGEAHNALLNHIHLYPIFNYTYKNANKTGKVLVDAEGTPIAAADTTTQPHPILSLRETLKKGLADARAAKRAGNILLVSDTKIDHIREALGTLHVRGTDFPSLTGITDIIGYDGWEIKVGKKSYSYAGVTAGKAFLIRPKRGFKELIKHDLLVDANMGDLSRLVEAQVVGRSRRGVYAALDENVQEIELP